MYKRQVDDGSTDSTASLAHTYEQKYPYLSLIHIFFPVEQPQCMRCGKPVLSERRESCDDCARALEHHRQMREDDSYRQGKALFAYKGSIKPVSYTHLDVYKRQGQG